MKNLKATDVSLQLKGRVLSIRVKKNEENTDSSQEYKKTMTLPSNLDISGLTSILTGEGNLRIQAPYESQGVQQQQQQQQQSKPPPPPQRTPQNPSTNTTTSQQGGGGEVPIMMAKSIGLELHNQYRKKHGVPLMKLDPEMCELAQKYAVSLSNGGLAPNTAGLGRNVFKLYGPTVVADTEAVRQAVASWYNHISGYTWDSPMNCARDAKLFTQLVWKSSVNLGIGVASNSSNGTTIVVGLYSKAGNVMSENHFRENVLPPIH